MNTYSFPSMTRGAKTNSGGSRIIANARIQAWATWLPKSLRRWPKSQGAQPSRAPLGQRKKGWPQRCKALRLRTTTQQFFRHPQTVRRVA
jgi:hypothetical protein